jgi:hypothetical protein
MWGYRPATCEWVLGRWTPEGVVTDEISTVGAETLTSVPPRARRTVAEAMQQQCGVVPPARMFDGPPHEQTSMTCPVCWAVSFDAGDVRERFCGHCGASHVWPAVAPGRPVTLVTVAGGGGLPSTVGGQGGNGDAAGWASTAVGS